MTLRALILVHAICFALFATRVNGDESCTLLIGPTSSGGSVSFYYTSNAIVRPEETYKLYLKGKLPLSTTCVCRGLELESRAQAKVNRFWIDIPCAYKTETNSIECQSAQESHPLHENTTVWAFYPILFSNSSLEDSVCVTGSMPSITHGAILDRDYLQTGSAKIERLSSVFLSPEHKILVESEIRESHVALAITLVVVLSIIVAAAAIKYKKRLGRFVATVKVKVSTLSQKFKSYAKLKNENEEEYEGVEMSRRSSRNEAPVPYITEEENRRLRQLLGADYLDKTHSSLTLDE